MIHKNRIKQILSLHHIFEGKISESKNRKIQKQVNSTEKVANKFKPRYSVYRLTHASIVFFSSAKHLSFNFLLFFLNSHHNRFHSIITIHFCHITNECFWNFFLFWFSKLKFHLCLRFLLSLFLYKQTERKNTPAFEIVSRFNAKPKKKKISWFQYCIISSLSCLAITWLVITKAWIPWFKSKMNWIYQRILAIGNHSFIIIMLHLYLMTLFLYFFRTSYHSPYEFHEEEEKKTTK